VGDCSRAVEGRRGVLRKRVTAKGVPRRDITPPKEKPDGRRSISAIGGLKQIKGGGRRSNICPGGKRGALHRRNLVFFYRIDHWKKDGDGAST